MKKILPIEVQHKINNQLCNAGFLCILLAYKNMYEWFYEHYVQLYFSSNKRVLYSEYYEMFLDFYGGWTDPRELFKVSTLNRKDVEQYNCASFESLIEEGKYIYCYVDEHYIQDVPHNSHDILVYGYDNETKIFEVIGFKDGFFQNYQVEYQTFLKAFQSGIEMSKKYDTHQGINYIFCIKPNFDEKTEYKFNMICFLERLKEFIGCIDSGELYKSDDPNHKMYEKEGNVFGLKVFQCLTEELEHCKKALGLIDYRAFHTLYEHNVIMKERLELFQEKIPGNKMTPAMQTSMEELVSLSNKLRMLAIKYNLKPDMESMNRIIKKTNSLYDLEKKIYTQIYSSLSV
ncbi:hypothetical protein [Anaeromicropila populeti]|uniref:Butirosin biosynthesis protein H, N-terminal n=1 Tax=Anaeromicropila populeti TaxID=37658 RepID=A0A1I6JAP4_9FIRM|nr:hypothetical protein [Anaeromicropila populeti]SFR76021.1 hypothetical protein SAMN05661086_01511 [Anaeromicropila populeti]